MYRAATGASPEDELRLARLALASTHDGIIMHRLDGTLVLFNEAAATNLGYTPEQFAALPPFGWTPPMSEEKVAKIISATRQPGGHIFKSSRRLPDGRDLSQEIHARFIDTEDGGLIVSVTHDITHRVQAEQLLRDLAYHDSLTGLANRAKFDERLDSAISAAQRHEDLLGIVFVDLDDFKDVNDTYGHETGDSVLIALAHRLEGAVRNEDTVARLGGDEFVVILPRLDRATDLERVASKLRAAIAKPLSIGMAELNLTAATGVSLFNPKSDDARSLLVRADIAMYETKRRSQRVLKRDG